MNVIIIVVVIIIYNYIFSLGSLILDFVKITVIFIIYLYCILYTD